MIEDGADFQLPEHPVDLGSIQHGRHSQYVRRSFEDEIDGYLGHLPGLLFERQSTQLRTDEVVLRRREEGKLRDTGTRAAGRGGLRRSAGAIPYGKNQGNKKTHRGSH